MLSNWISELRHGLRALLRRPGFFAAAVITLALAIGANTAIFSIVHGVLWKPLPYAEPERLVHVFRTQPPIAQSPISRPDFLVWRERQHVFERIAAYHWQNFILAGQGQAERLRGVKVTEEFFPILGLRPVAGRFLDASDERGENGPVVVISERLWERRFGRAADLVGRTVELDQQAFTVVGIAPAELAFPAIIDVWTPARLAASDRARGTNYLQVVARLGASMTPVAARKQMDAICADLAREFPDHDANLSTEVVPFQAFLTRGLGSTLLVLAASVGLVLLIACANVASLLLVRAQGRVRELALRSALGASRWRIARQTLVEAILIAASGGVAGVALAYAAIETLRGLNHGLPLMAQVSIDPQALAFVSVVALLSALLAGIAPALLMRGERNFVALKSSESGTVAAGGGRTRTLLVAGEVALALSLMVGATLLVRSLANMAAVDPGFDPRPLLSAQVLFPAIDTKQAKGTSGLGDPGPVLRRVEALQQRLAALPGVRAVGGINDLPMSGNSDVNGDFEIEGKPRADKSASQVAEFRLITPNYFSTMGIALLHGRYFDPASERAGTPIKIMINETLARKYFGDEDPIGRRIQVLDMEMHEVIGVVAAARQWGPTMDASPEIYFSVTQVPWENLALVLKIDGDPAALADSVPTAIGEVSHDIAILKLATLERVIADGTGRTRFLWLVMGTFGLLALVLAVVGVYGVSAYDASQRTREMGVRLSLGAQPRSLVRLVVARGLRVVAAGAAVGLIAALMMGKAMQGLLFGVSALDAPSLAGGVAVLGIAALVAVALPAWRAARTDPMAALRYE